MQTAISLGPIFHFWPEQARKDFYFRIADEAPISTVYLGEVICAKRAPMVSGSDQEIIDRLTRAGKTIVRSTLAQVTVTTDRRLVASICERRDGEIEVNDASALWKLDGRRFRIGQLFNCYNEGTLAFLATRGATHVCVPAEMSGEAIAALAARAGELGLSVEAQVFGRLPLALSARCYHARAHDRTHDNCRFVCEEDPDGMPLKTLDGQDFLTVNGIQTLSETYLNLAAEMPIMRKSGVSLFRLSPQAVDMVEVANIFDAVLSESIVADEAGDRLAALPGTPELSNGFFHRVPGYLRHTSA